MFPNLRIEEGLKQLIELGSRLVKQAQDETVEKPEVSYSLSGVLYLSKSGWLLLSVPNALVRGVFMALDEPGVELPRDDEGNFSAHISVMTPEEIEKIGGPAVLNPERGKRFRYTLGNFVSVRPNWKKYSRVWFIRVHSEDLMKLRRSYGLTSRPNNNQYDFHITCAARRWGVLGYNPEHKKAAGDSYYLRALRQTPLVWDNSQPVTTNLLRYLNQVKLRGDQLIQQARTAEDFRSQADLTYASQRFLDYLHGRRGPIVSHPLDVALQAVPAKVAEHRTLRFQSTSFSLMRDGQPVFSVTVQMGPELMDEPEQALLEPPEEDDDEPKDHPPIVAVDLDGTLAEDEGPFDPNKIGRPRKGAREFMRALAAEGYLLIINTCRGQTETVRRWLEEHDIPYDYINENPHQPEDCSDKILASAYVDDRAVPADDLDDALDKVKAKIKEEDKRE